VLERADLELLPMRSLLGAATRLALALAQPAYDCLYLALAAREGCGFVTADATLIRKVRQASLAGAPVIHSLAEGAALVT
jgi:predicted nucleic acid-binding protein